MVLLKIKMKWLEKVKEEILKIQPKENSNIIISAHNGVVRATNIFDRIDNKNYDFSNIEGKFMNEGGFIVMKNVNGKLVFVDVFYTFHKFYRNLYERPSD